MTDSASKAPALPVNLNTATLEELTQLSGVGPALARRIIAARPFDSVRDLRLVSGVGGKLYATLRPLVTVSEPPPQPKVMPTASPSASPREGLEPAAPERQAPPADRVAPLLGETPSPEEPSRPERKPGLPGQPGVEPASPPPPSARARSAASASVPLRSMRPLSQGRYPIRAGIYFPRSRRRYRLPGETKWRVLLVLFYGVVGLALLGVAVLVMAWYRSISTPVGSRSSSPTAAVSSATLQPTTAVGLAVASTTAAPIAQPTTVSNEAAATQSLTATAAATSSPTPAPTATPVPTTPAGAGALLFAESFEPAGYYWGVGNTTLSRSEISNGQLTIHVDRGAFHFIYGGMKPAKDFYYQATTSVGPCAEGDNYGLLVRARDDRNFFLFGVTCDGGARVQALLNDAYTVMANTPTQSAIHAGDGAVNVLAVRAVGNDLEFYANGERVAVLSDLNPASGHFGLYVKSARTPTLDVSFDDVIGWQAAP